MVLACITTLLPMWNHLVSSQIKGNFWIPWMQSAKCTMALNWLCLQLTNIINTTHRTKWIFSMDKIHTHIYIYIFLLFYPLSLCMCIQRNAFTKWGLHKCKYYACSECSLTKALEVKPAMLESSRKQHKQCHCWCASLRSKPLSWPPFWLTSTVGPLSQYLRFNRLQACKWGSIKLLSSAMEVSDTQIQWHSFHKESLCYIPKFNSVYTK